MEGNVMEQFDAQIKDGSNRLTIIIHLMQKAVFRKLKGTIM